MSPLFRPTSPRDQQWIRERIAAPEEAVFAEIFTFAVSNGCFQVSAPERPPPPNSHSRLYPIEAFRESSLAQGLYATQDWQATFISSGTSTSVRAQSKFSQRGLHLYKTFASLTFANIVQRLDENYRDFRQIYSLIPTDDKSSSLSTMISWLSALYPVKFVPFDQAPDFFQSLAPDNKSLFFATALHWQYLLDIKSISLPKNSLLFETGGSKDKEKTLSTAEFHERLSQWSGLPLARIVSEYGMCELASQAYGQTVKGRCEWVWPFWVEWDTVDPFYLFTKRNHPTGLICIYDPLRCDVPHWIRTQDIVERLSPQSFEIKGRAPYAPLKGCSLNFPIQTKTEIRNIQKKINAPPLNMQKLKLLDQDTVRQRYKDIMITFEEIFQKKDFLEIFASEHKMTPENALSFLDEFKKSLPKTDLDIDDALINSTGESSALSKSQVPDIYQKWLFIGPSSHDFALFYPLLFACAFDFDVTIRLQNYASCAYLVDHLKTKHPLKLSTVPNSDLLKETTYKDRAVLLYASDSTIRDFKNHYSVVKGFGDSFCLGVTESLSDLDPTLFLKEIFYLGHRGCLNPRALFVRRFQKKDFTDWIDRLLATLKSRQTSRDSTEAFNHVYGCHFELSRFPSGSLCDFVVLPGLSLALLNEAPQDCLSKIPFFLPVFAAEGVDLFAEWRSLNLASFKARTLKVISNDPSLISDGILFAKWGEAQFPKADGTWQGQPLFQT